MRTGILTVLFSICFYVFGSAFLRELEGGTAKLEMYECVILLASILCTILYCVLETIPVETEDEYYGYDKDQFDADHFDHYSEGNPSTRV